MQIRERRAGMAVRSSQDPPETTGAEASLLGVDSLRDSVDGVACWEVVASCAGAACCEDEASFDEDDDEDSCAEEDGCEEEDCADDEGSCDEDDSCDEGAACSEEACGACAGAASGGPEPLEEELLEEWLVLCPLVLFVAPWLAELECRVLPGNACAATSVSNAVRATLATISQRLIRVSLRSAASRTMFVSWRTEVSVCVARLRVR